MLYRTQTGSRKKRFVSPLILLALLFSLLPAFQPSLAVHAEGEPASYVILAKNALPDDLAQKVADAGGSLTSAMSEIGVAVATSTDPNFAANAGKIKGIQSVTRDVSVEWVTGQDFAWTGQDFSWTGQDFSWTGQDYTWTGQSFTYTGQAQNPPNTLNDDYFFNFQWNLDAINAPEAWELGPRARASGLPCWTLVLSCIIRIFAAFSISASVAHPPIATLTWLPEKTWLRDEAGDEIETLQFNNIACPCPATPPTSPASSPPRTTAWG